jgi:hypothetical protein
MSTQASAEESHATVKDQVVELYQDVKHEVQSEIHNPLDSPQGDLLVRKHVNGLAITLFILIALAVLAAIGGYAMYAH